MARGRSPLILALAFALAARRAAPARRSTISDVEDEVMCPICGTLLELADSPQAQREKAFIAKMIADGQEQGRDQGRAGRPVRHRGARRARGLRLRPLRLPGAGDRPRSSPSSALAVGVARWRRRGGRRPALPPRGPGRRGRRAPRRRHRPLRPLTPAGRSAVDDDPARPTGMPAGLLEAAAGAARGKRGPTQASTTSACSASRPQRAAVVAERRAVEDERS